MSPKSKKARQRPATAPPDITEAEIDALDQEFMVHMENAKKAEKRGVKVPLLDDLRAHCVNKAPRK